MTQTLTLILLSALTLTPCCFGEAAPVVASQAAPTVTTQEQTLLDLEKARFAAIVDARVDELDKLLDDTLVYVHSNTKVDTKEMYLAALKSGQSDYQSIDVGELRARVYGAAAVLTGTARMKVFFEGNQLNIHVRFTDVWVRRDGDWRMVSWQATRIPE